MSNSLYDIMYDGGSLISNIKRPISIYPWSVLNVKERLKEYLCGVSEWEINDKEIIDHWVDYQIYLCHMNINTICDNCKLLLKDFKKAYARNGQTK